MAWFWICDNESDAVIIECQKEIRRLRGVVRQLEAEVKENTCSERAVWKDHKVVGYVCLTDKQTEELNSLKGIDIYIGFDRKTNPNICKED